MSLLPLAPLFLPTSYFSATGKIQKYVFQSATRCARSAVSECNQVLRFPLSASSSPTSQDANRRRRLVSVRRAFEAAAIPVCLNVATD